MASNPDVETPRPSGEKKPEAIKFGSQAVIGVKAGAAVMGILILIWYIVFLSYTDSPFWMMGIIVGAIGLAIGIAGIFIGKISISRKKNIPTLNVILIILSIILLFTMPLLGSWEDPSTFGKELWSYIVMFKVLIFAIFFLCYIELSHASMRFSEIDEYSTSHNIKDFSVNSVITNYFVWFGILVAIICALSLLILLLQIFLSGPIQASAPQFGYSVEYNSIYSILISIALIFVPIGIILSFVFGFKYKSRRKIIVKSKEDVVARKPEAVEVE
jgi:hypothetical protein